MMKTTRIISRRRTIAPDTTINSNELLESNSPVLARVGSEVTVGVTEQIGSPAEDILTVQELSTLILATPDIRPDLDFTQSVI